MDPAQLRAVIASAQAGSADAYRVLLEAYGRRLYGYFFRACGNHHEAEDLLGEMTLRLVRQLRRYDDRGRFEPWLFRIAANMVRDRIRRYRAKAPPVSLSSESDSSAPLSDRLVSDDPAVDSATLASEDSTELNAALNKLDGRTREMMLLRHFGQMSFKDIADIYNCPLGTVLARVHRGLAALRSMMGDRHGT